MAAKPPYASSPLLLSLSSSLALLFSSAVSVTVTNSLVVLEFKLVKLVLHGVVPELVTVVDSREDVVVGPVVEAVVFADVVAAVVDEVAVVVAVAVEFMGPLEVVVGVVYL